MPAQRPARHARLSYAPGLDGVRALAVTAVILYHLGTTGVTIGTTGAGVPRLIAPGGFLGVDVFFVLSGFLITSLLLAERAESGRISIRNFYIRRARRLLPALYTMLVVVAASAAFWFTDYAARLRGDLVAAFTYVTNWWLIAGGSSYFGGGDHPPLLTHLWSLALEEQFYLLWPLALIALTFVRRRGTVLFAVGIAVLASTVLAAALFNPFQDPSRIYYGTDTRLATPLLGALLAVAFRPWLWHGPLRAGVRRLLNVGGLLAIVALGVACVLLTDQTPALYEGGFLVIAIAAGVLVLAAAHPDVAVGRALGVAPLRWLGERSYAIYLWHWPIFVLTHPGEDGVSWPFGLTGGTGAIVVTAFRIGLTLLLSDLSYRFVEKPMRSGALGRWWKKWRASTGKARSMGTLRGSTVGFAAVLLVAVVGAQLVAARAPSDVPVGPGPDTSLGALQVPTPTPVASGNPSAHPTATPTSTGPLKPPASVPKVVVFGDSQGMTMLINKPSDTSKYVNFKDDTISGCGILLGKVASRSGEKRDLTSNCKNWLAEWRSRANSDKPDIGLIMIGAWDVFDLTTGGTTLTFGSPEWDANFTAALDQGIAAIHDSGAQVALSLLPCYRPVAANIGKGAGYWPERGDDDRTRHVNTLLTAAAAANPGYVTAVNPPVQFCDDPKISKSLSYRWDGVHYYKPGALLYCQAVIPQLLAIKLS
ncbi:MAG TPA: acyltransferase family protein [Micromonosporaceae bacterium]|nr:acyltransferase family protein [Micromonosporaceae bacterium]